MDDSQQQIIDKLNKLQAAIDALADKSNLTQEQQEKEWNKAVADTQRMKRPNQYIDKAFAIAQSIR